MQIALWDVEQVDTMPAVRDMSIASVTTTDVQEFCRRYHYTRLGNNVNWRYGLWYGPVLLGVVAYNIPTREACMSVFGEINMQHVWHMGRLALAETAPRNSESRLIGGSLRAITREHPEVWAILTYAATDAGHIGYVYQATNAIYTGTGGDPVYYTDQQGNRRGTHMWENRVTNATQAAAAGWTRHRGGVKHRYVYVLGTKRQRRERLGMLQLPVLPYPKA